MGCLEGKPSRAWEDRQRDYRSGVIDDDRVRCIDCASWRQQKRVEKLRTGFTQRADPEYKETRVATCIRGCGAHPDILRRCVLFQPTREVQGCAEL